MARKSRKNLNVVKAIEKYKELEPQNVLMLWRQQRIFAYLWKIMDRRQMTA